MIKYEEIIYIISIALQIAGAVMFMISFWGDVQKKTLSLYFPGSNSEERDKEDKITLSKDRLRKCANEIYLNRIAFIYIVLGYLSNVYANINSSDKVCIVAKIFMVSVLLLGIGKGIAWLLSVIVYRSDKKIDYKDVADKIITPITGDEITQMFEGQVEEESCVVDDVNDKKETIHELKRKKMEREFIITMLSGFLIPIIFFIYSLIATYTEGETCIAIVVGTITAIIYFVIAKNAHEKCIEYEMEIDKLESK